MTVFPRNTAAHGFELALVHRQYDDVGAPAGMFGGDEADGAVEPRRQFLDMRAGDEDRAEPFVIDECLQANGPGRDP